MQWTHGAIEHGDVDLVTGLEIAQERMRADDGARGFAVDEIADAVDTGEVVDLRGEGRGHDGEAGLLEETDAAFDGLMHRGQDAGAHVPGVPGDNDVEGFELGEV